MEREFLGIYIPRELWLNSELSWTKRILLAEIDSLNRDGAGCYATNAYLAEFLGMKTKNRIGDMINELTREGYIRSKLIYREGSREIAKRLLWVARPLGSKFPADTPIPEMGDTPSPKQGTPPPSNEGDPLPQNGDTLSPKKGRRGNKTRDNNESSKRDTTTDTTASVQDVVDAYHEICKSYSRVVKLTEKRAKAVRAIIKDFSLDEIMQAFTIAEGNEFLKGHTERGWRATFDWMMIPTNLAKILEGNYTETRGSGKRTAPATGMDAVRANINYEQEAQEWNW